MHLSPDRLLLLKMEEKVYGTIFIPKKSSNYTARKLSKKIYETITRLLYSVLFCCPGKSDVPRNSKSLEEFPNEILLKIMTYCDFTSKMNMRAVNHRFYTLVERGAHSLARRNLIGGVEIKRGDVHVKDTFDPGEAHSFTCPTLHVTLCRPLKRLEILVPATRLANVMRHVCVCHSLKLCGVSLDEVMASNILDASFRAISDLIIDRVHTVTAETLSQLVRKAHPSGKLAFCNHSTMQSSEAIVPDLLLCCPAQDVSIEPSVTMLHRTFDDAALVRLVISDQAIRRTIRLPLCAITHRGISRAAQAFYKRCCDVIAELTTEMHAPKWEISVSFPSSILIDRSLIEIPIEMIGQCTIWSFFPQYGESFTVEVRVGGMNLRIIVEST